MTKLSPTKTSVSIVIRDANDDFLVVKRPNDPTDELANMWGFPAVSLHEGEQIEAAAKRIGKEKLGVEIALGRVIAESTHDRGWGILRLVDFEATILSGEPSVPQSDPSITQYSDWRFTDDWKLLLPAAHAGSQCTQLFLDDIRVQWQK